MKTMEVKFVDSVPEPCNKGVLYISISFNTAIHLCACGCGMEVVTPLKKDGWRFTYDGDTVTLRPSIGNWELPCRSHYFITDNKIEWSYGWKLYTKQTEGKKKKKKSKKKWLG
jgi:hypothetical protein